jgi:hypothetical protein
MDTRLSIVARVGHVGESPYTGVAEAFCEFFQQLRGASFVAGLTDECAQHAIGTVLKRTRRLMACVDALSLLFDQSLESVRFA